MQSTRVAILGVDVGGTFTDAVFLDGGRVRTAKVPTAARQEESVVAAARAVGARDVERAKPRPDLYLEACELLEVAPAEAIAFEDSPNGVRAARAAGIFCVAIPNEVTRTLGLEEADLVIDSLADLPAAELLARFD